MCSSDLVPFDHRDLHSFPTRRSSDLADLGDLDELKWSFIDPLIRKHLLAAELEIQERASGTKLLLLTMPGTRLG